MCNQCTGCGAKLVHAEDLSATMKKKLGIKTPFDYEYCCICPNGCPDQRPNGSDKCEMCCNCS